MTSSKQFERARQNIDRIDESILDLLAERNRQVAEIARYKQVAGLPVFVAAREADIVFATAERRRLLLDFFEHHERLAEMIRREDRDGFIREFEAIADFFGDFAETALTESGYLINRLADRFA